MDPIRIAAAIAVAALVAACGGNGNGSATGDGNGEAEAPRPETDAATPDVATARYEAETVVGGLEVPWDLVRLPNGDLLVSERAGSIRLVGGGELAAEPVARVDAAPQGEGGLLGLALHPEYPDEPWLYAYATRAGGNAIVRMRLEQSDGGWAVGGEEVVLDGIPAAAFHVGGRIAFGPDGMLYAGTGDAGDPAASADRRSLAGKVLRLTPAGEVPEDNPIDGSPVWAYGLRNVQGLAWDDEGRLYATDHGPSGELGLCCKDELNLIERGGFYGWPFRAGGEPAAGGDPPAEPIDPLATSGSNETWAPSGVAVVDPGDAPTVVFVAELAGERLQRLVLGGDGASVESSDAALDGLGRLRHVVAGEQGCLLVLTSNRDGRGSPAEQDDRLVRACPADSP